MNYFVYCRDRPGAGALREQTKDAHWTFMDTYAAGFVARGPTLTDDGKAHTGSMHIVDLPDTAAAQRFAYEEPRYKAGVHSEVFVSRWRNDSARNMWDFATLPGNEQRFLIIARGARGKSDAAAALLERRRDYFVQRKVESRVIVNGSLVSDDGQTWSGTALMIQMPDRAAFDALWQDDPLVQGAAYESVEVHRWMFGGRR